MQNIKVYAFSSKPGEYLKKAILQRVADLQIKAGRINTCVGSLTGYAIRFANQATAFRNTGYFEILSLTGTVSINGYHLHILESDGTGKTLDGHLCGGCIVNTTAEIVISSSDDFIFKRENDGSSPWNELHIN
jgi:predicted DNA-binding protein with PD1-like motif